MDMNRVHNLQISNNELKIPFHALIVFIKAYCHIKIYIADDNSPRVAIVIDLNIIIWIIGTLSRIFNGSIMVVITHYSLLISQTEDYVNGSA